MNAGSYSYIWDAITEPSGVYLAELSTNNIVQVQKLVYLK